MENYTTAVNLIIFIYVNRVKPRYNGLNSGTGMFVKAENQLYNKVGLRNANMSKN